MPISRRNLNTFHSHLVKLQPILGLPWPTLVLEVGNLEGAPKLIQNRNKYLGHETQINIYVGVSYNRDASRNDDSWWMCVAYRDVNAPQPPPGTSPEYPPPIIVGEFQKVNGTRWPNVNVPIAQNASVWSIPSCYSIRNRNQQQFPHSRMHSISMLRCFVSVF
jgi:hypothetical protein